MRRRPLLRAGGILLIATGIALGYESLIGFSSRIPSPTFTGRVTVLTYNVQTTREPSIETERVIRAADADVVCLQEVSPAWHGFLWPRLRDRYPAALHRDFRGGYGGLAFYSKYPLRDIQYLLPPAGAWYPAWVVEAETPAGAVQIANLHFRALRADRGGSAVGYFTIPRMHRREVDAILDVLTPDVPTLLIGDFNGNEDDPGVWNACYAGFVDVLPIFDQSTPTWRGRLWKFPISARPDHILCSPHFRAEGARVLDSGGSDHCPVWSELTRVNSPMTLPIRIEMPYGATNVTSRI